MEMKCSKMMTQKFKNHGKRLWEWDVFSVSICPVKRSRFWYISNVFNVWTVVEGEPVSSKIHSSDFWAVALTDLRSGTYFRWLVVMYHQRTLVCCAPPIAWNKEKGRALNLATIVNLCLCLSIICWKVVSSFSCNLNCGRMVFEISKHVISQYT